MSWLKSIERDTYRALQESKLIRQFNISYERTENFIWNCQFSKCSQAIQIRRVGVFWIIVITC